MKKTFYRVQNKTKPNDFTEFETIEEAREFCDQWALTEKTHQLEKWEPNQKSSHCDIQMSFFFLNDKPHGAVIHRVNDSSHINVLAAMANQNAVGKVQYEKPK